MVSAACGIVVLMYHRVTDILDPGELVVPVENFRQQMAALAQKYEVIGIEELSFEEKREKQKVVITFDDGYRDNYLNAYPILKKRDFPAALFLITGMIGTKARRPRYKDMPSPDMLSWEEVNEMAAGGMTFGAHTVTHPRLSGLGEEAQREEIEKSLREVQSHVAPLKGSKSFFCYPYGDYNKTTLAILREFDVKLAFTVDPGVNQEGQIALEIKRIGISGTDSLTDFQKKIETGR